MTNHIWDIYHSQFGSRKWVFSGLMSPGQSHVTLLTCDTSPRHQPITPTSQQPRQRADHHNHSKSNHSNHNHSNHSNHIDPHNSNNSEEETKSGPNDAGRVVWAIGMFFFSFFRIFLLLTSLFMFYSCYTGMGRLREGCSDENGPNRRRSRRLGHK